MADALDAVRASRVPAESLHVVFVMDDQGHPVGSATVASLVRARADETALAVSRVPLTHVHPHWDVHRRWRAR